jgi:hypothetical protein
MNYADFIFRLSEGLGTVQSDADLVTLVPATIDAAEQRLYRELDPLNTVTTDASAHFNINTRTFNLPSANGTFSVIDNIYAITPASQTTPDVGTRNPLVPVSRAYLDAIYPSSAGSTVPAYFAMVTQTSIIVGPWPDQSYQAEIVGTIRPPPLGSTNVTTILSVYFPDLFLAAAMSFACNWQYQTSTASPLDQQRAVTWENYYQQLKNSAQTEEARKKFTSDAWSSKQPTTQVARV